LVTAAWTIISIFIAGLASFADMQARDGGASLSIQLSRTALVSS
jgi:hypothetical protein